MSTHVQFKRFQREHKNCDLCKKELGREYIQVEAGPIAIINLFLCLQCCDWMRNLGRAVFDRD